MINEIGNISNKNFSAINIQGKNIAGNSSSLISTGTISGQPKNDINVQKIKLKEACTQFEQIFIKYMVDKMWSSTDAGSGKQSIEKSIWQDYFNNEISKVIAESSLTGISETLFEQLGSLGSAQSSEDCVDAVDAIESVDAIDGLDAEVSVA